MRPGQIEKGCRTVNWSKYEIDRTRLAMYMPIQTKNPVLAPLTTEEMVEKTDRESDENCFKAPVI